VKTITVRVEDRAGKLIAAHENLDEQTAETMVNRLRAANPNALIVRTEIGHPFAATVGWLAQNLGRYEIAYVPADDWLAVGAETVTNQPDAVEWLPITEVTPGDLIAVLAGGQRFGPFAAVRQIVLRRTEVQP
jgi:hypothetical protein